MTPFRAGLRALFTLCIVVTLAGPVAAQEDEPLQVVIGEADAPVTVIEYMSLTCPHCAEFHRETLPRLMETYVDTGQVRVVFRDFPLDGPAFQAAIVTHCMAEAGPKRYYGFVQVLFQQQDRWARAADPMDAVGKLARIGGMSEERFEACLENEEYATGVLTSRQTAERQFGIRSTPSFVVNGRVIAGAISLGEFEEILEPLVN